MTVYRLTFFFIVCCGLALEAQGADGTAISTADPVVQPYAPSYVASGLGRDLKVEDWEDPAICAGCHPTQFKGWNGSMHANAFKDPVFQAEWALAKKELGDEISNLCGGCHAPQGVLSQSFKWEPRKGKHGGFSGPAIVEHGVMCDVCHTISDTNVHTTKMLEHGNASFVASPGKIKRGPLRDAKSPYHQTAYSDHHTKAEFCGNCHNVFNPLTNFPLERTYDEWKYSVYAQNDVQCQDCHMVPLETAIEVADTLTPAKRLKNNKLSGFAGLGAANQRDVVHAHGFVGGNAVITAAMGDSAAIEHAEIAKKRLKSAAAVELSLKPPKGQGPLRKLEVKVINKRAGHHIPTSLTYVRQIWLDVTVTDDKGNVLLRSGALDAHNEIDPDAVVFQAKAVDTEGKPAHYIWKIARFETRNTIPPKGYQTGEYWFNLPQGVDQINVVAKLNYRSFSQHMADDLLGEGEVEVPFVEMVKVEHSYAGKELAAAHGDTPAQVAHTETVAVE